MTKCLGLKTIQTNVFANKILFYFLAHYNTMDNANDPDELRIAVVLGVRGDSWIVDWSTLIESNPIRYRMKL